MYSVVGVVETASCADREMGSDDGTNADADAKRTADTDNGDNRTMLEVIYLTVHGSEPPAKMVVVSAMAWSHGLAVVLLSSTSESGFCLLIFVASHVKPRGRERELDRKYM